MAEFKIAFAVTSGNEGGWQNDPDDRGNDKSGLGTYKGIACAIQPDWSGWKIVRQAIDCLPPQPKYDSADYYQWVRRLNGTLKANEALQQMVEDFYRKNFWEVNSLGAFTSQEVANKVYDCGVNQGTKTAAKILQSCLRVKVDGCIGPITIAAANSRNGDELAKAFRDARIAKYHDLVRVNPRLAQYLDGWIARC